MLSTPLPRRGRLAALIGAGLLASVALTACQKPLPGITVYGDGRSIGVPAATYRYPDGPVHTKITDFAKAPTLKVQPGSDLLVDVPKELADHSWVVAAFTLDAAGKSTALAGAGSSVNSTHSARLTAPTNLTGDYYLQVAELRGATQVGGWVVRVRVAN